MLFVLAEVKEVFAPVMSAGAIEAFRKYEISASCNQCVQTHRQSIRLRSLPHGAGCSTDIGSTGSPACSQRNGRKARPAARTMRMPTANCVDTQHSI